MKLKLFLHKKWYCYWESIWRDQTSGHGVVYWNIYENGRTTEKVVCVARSPYIRIHTGHKAPVLIKLDVVRDSYNSKGRDRCKTDLSSLWDEIWTDANDRAVIRKICAPSSAFALPATYHRAGIQRSGWRGVQQPHHECSKNSCQNWSRIFFFVRIIEDQYILLL